MVRQIMRCNWFLVKTKIYLIVVSLFPVVSPPYVIFMGADKHESELIFYCWNFLSSISDSIELTFFLTRFYTM